MTLPKMLTHEVSMSLREGSICPSCGDGRLISSETENGLRYWCPSCATTHSASVNRWRQKYSRQLPSSDTHDTFTSIERLDTEGNISVNYVVDVDTNSREDADRVFQKVQEYAGNVVQLHFSGNKGYHIVIPYEKWSYHNGQWPNVFKVLAELLDISDVADTAIYMPRGMLRVPGSYHSVSGKHKELLIDCDHDAAVKDSWKTLVETAEERATTTYPTKDAAEASTFELLSHFTPPCIQNLWLNGIPHEGSRHATYLHLISFYYRRGDAQEETLELLQDFAEEFSENTNTSEAIRVSEAERLTRSAYRSGLGFDCERGQSIGVCEDTCPLFKP